jgi:hypothetical protein
MNLVSPAKAKASMRPGVPEMVPISFLTLALLDLSRRMISLLLQD